MYLTNKYITQYLHSMVTYLFVTIFMHLVHTSPGDNSIIDQQHLNEYPFCGSMLYDDPSNSPTGRVVNSETPKNKYRWVVLVVRENLLIVGPKLPGKMVTTKCSGSIITDRYSCTIIRKYIYSTLEK